MYFFKKICLARRSLLFCKEDIDGKLGALEVHEKEISWTALSTDFQKQLHLTEWLYKGKGMVPYDCTSCFVPGNA